uniref:Uncharacterized protein n=1 Tax=Brassica oleracea TaxID=3712 RepID=A0A3P6GZK1_BRAOL|nr:unnamed protein product [Brassica oleracea]
MFHTNGFESITMGSSARDLVALTNEALSISKISSGSWDPFLSDRKGCCTKCTYKKGSHDPEPILPGIANPKFVYEEQI